MSDLIKYWKEHEIEAWSDMFVLEREEPITKVGSIHLAEDAQRVPITGIVVSAPEKYPEFMGKRLYFRPGTEWMVPLGGQGEGPEACLLHIKDIKIVEVV